MLSLVHFHYFASLLTKAQLTLQYMLNKSQREAQNKEKSSQSYTVQAERVIEIFFFVLRLAETGSLL